MPRLTWFTRLLLWLLSTRPDVASVTEISTACTQATSTAQELDPDELLDDVDDYAFTVEHLEYCLTLDPSRHDHTN